MYQFSRFLAVQEAGINIEIVHLIAHAIAITIEIVQKKAGVNTPLESVHNETLHLVMSTMSKKIVIFIFAITIAFL